MACCIWKLLAVISFWSWFALCTRFELSNWKVFNDNTLNEFTAGQGYGTYRLIVSQDRRPLISDNRTFGLAFLNLNGTGQYFLCIMLAVNTSLALPIWTANRNIPLSQGAAVQIMGGDMRLLDAQGNLVWSPFQLVIRGIELHESGNFRLFDDGNKTLWQSFDSMTDVLMPGQKFQTGNQLIGNLNQSSLAPGPFLTAMEASGLALYLTATESGTVVSPQPYSISTMQNTTVKRQLSTVLYQCPSYKAVFSYSGPDWELEYEASDHPVSLPCSSPRKVHFAIVNTSLIMRFLRLEYNGDLVSYGFDQSSHQWKADFSWESLVKDKVCPYPLSCGSYGLCQPQGGCKCLSQKTQSYDIASEGACSPPPSASLPEYDCDSSEEVEFVHVLGVSYFSSKLLQPGMISPSVDKCLQVCKPNCSCSAVFYDKDAQGCYFVEEVLGSLGSDASKVLQYSAHLKFRGGGSHQHRILGRGKLATVIALPLGGGILLPALVGFLWWARRRQQLRLEEKTVKSLLSSMPGSPPHRFSYTSLYLATNRFTEKLGQGGFGAVFAGKLPTGTRLAVKRLQVAQMQGEKEFTAEVVSLGSISHVNIVKLCGFCVKGGSRFLVYELVVNGSLDKWLFKEDHKFLSWELRMRVALGTARGLAYLHEECREPILHLDVKPQNILLDADFTPKVADFGLSKLLTDRDITQVVTGVRGTPGYVAPEWITNSIATKKCDVYGFGMVLFELVSGRKNLDPEFSQCYFPDWAVQEMNAHATMNLIDSRIRSPEIVEQVETVLQIAVSCTQTNASARPSMRTVIQMLEGHEVPRIDNVNEAFNYDVTPSSTAFVSDASSLQGR